MCSLSLDHHAVDFEINETKRDKTSPRQPLQGSPFDSAGFGS